jgi:hypothetical protein
VTTGSQRCASLLLLLTRTLLPLLLLLLRVLLLWSALQVGLNYICATAERFFAVGAVLGNMVVMLAEQPSPRLLKHIIRCYLRLSDNPRWVLGGAALRFFADNPFHRACKSWLDTYPFAVRKHCTCDVCCATRSLYAAVLSQSAC